MRDTRRLLFATIFALACGVLVAFGNPVDRIKADLRADAQGVVISLEYSVRALRG